jgi:hypothetical protein
MLCHASLVERVLIWFHEFLCVINTQFFLKCFQHANIELYVVKLLKMEMIYENNDIIILFYFWYCKLQGTNENILILQSYGTLIITNVEPTKRIQFFYKKMSTRIPLFLKSKILFSKLWMIMKKGWYTLFVTYLILLFVLLLLSSLPICFQLLWVGHFFNTYSKIEKKSKAWQKAYQDFLKTHVGHD